MRTQTSAETATPVAEAPNTDRPTEGRSSAAASARTSGAPAPGSTDSPSTGFSNTAATNTTSTRTASPDSADSASPAQGRTDAEAEAGHQDDSDVDVVRLALPAASAYVTVLRSTTAALAARIDFTIDEIEDLRIAVDEACALLLAQAIRGTELSCTFRLSGTALSFSATAEATEPRVPSRDSFAWTVLTALVSDVQATVDADTGRSTLTLDKQAIAVRASAHDGHGPQQNESGHESTDLQSPSSETAE